MYKEMRRKDRAISAEEAHQLLRTTDFGFLGLAGKDGKPYVVPLNHVVVDDCLVFHCAKEGQKLDLIRENPSVCYAVCTEHEVIPEELTTKYKSAIVFGTAEIVEDPETKTSLLKALSTGIAPGIPFKCGPETVARTSVVRVKIEKVTGKKSG